MWLSSQRYISNFTRGSTFQITTFTESIATQEGKAELPLQSEKAYHITMWTYLLISIEATGVCIPIGNSEILLAAIHRSPGRAWIDADFTELLNFRNKCSLTGDLNAKYQFWNSRFSNPSGEKLGKLFDLDDFQI
jgi:hypothetical protein